MIVVLEGSGALRQGSAYTPIEAGEVHGTVNDSGAPARLTSFQSPPNPTLYAGRRDHAAGSSPLPSSGHRSEVRVFALVKGDRHARSRYGVVFLQHGDQFLLTIEAEPVTLLRCYSLPTRMNRS